MIYFIAVFYFFIRLFDDLLGIGGRKRDINQGTDPRILTGKCNDGDIIGMIECPNCGKAIQKSIWANCTSSKCSCGYVLRQMYESGKNVEFMGKKRIYRHYNKDNTFVFLTGKQEFFRYGLPVILIIALLIYFLIYLMIQ